jgi:tetratricopeptide (TPR) repeat protein
MARPSVKISPPPNNVSAIDARAAQLLPRIMSEALEHVKNGDGAKAVACLNSHGGVALGNELACNLLGLIHASAGEDAKALAAFDRALALRPNNVDVMANRALILQRLGEFEAAIGAHDAVLAARPDDAPTRYNRGAAAHLLGRAEEALADYDRALSSRPDYREALVGRAIVLAELGRCEEALASCDVALRFEPADAVTHYNRADLLRRLGRDDEALAAYGEALRYHPDYTDALCGCAVILNRQGRFDEALASCTRALRGAPKHFAALFNQANIFYAAGRIQEACASFDAAAELRPEDPDVLSNRAASLLELGRLPEALVSCDEALRHRPNFPEAFSNRGNILQKLQRFDEAVLAYDAALALRPSYVEALCGRGVGLKELARFDEALASFDAALRANPAHAHSQNNCGALLLLQGDFERGWEDYESRWLKENLPVNALPRTFPQWKGEPLGGKRMLVLDEQGLGDVIQFCRYLPKLAEAGADVTFICRKHLHRLLRSLAGNIRLVDAPIVGESFDYEIPLVSLPKAFGARQDNILAQLPYLHAEPELVRHWAERIGQDGLRIGISWQGNPNLKADTARSLALQCFAPLARIPGVRLVSLQKNSGAKQLGNGTAFPVETLGDEFDAGPDAFVDTAAVMAGLDLIITCDTSIAHLGGALGKPVWVALKSVPDWRWMLEREDTPWYPQMRLFRQKRRGDWDEVFTRMAQELEQTQRPAAQSAPSSILIPGAVGELIDKITILEIKAERITDPAKLRNVTHELELLRQLRQEGGFESTELDTLTERLKVINLALWEIEDEIRICEQHGDFGETFIRLARSVYQTNDKRAALKRDVNVLCNSSIVEEKSYAGGTAAS